MTRACLVLLLAGAALPATDPFPIRRIQIDPARLPAEVRRQQELLPMPRAAFEDLVQRAARRQRAAPPRLLELRLRGTLQDGQLTGTADLVLAQPDGGRGLFRLEPWGLALRGRPLLNGQPAPCGELDDTATGVLVDGPGPHTLTLGWSVRAEPRPEGGAYFLQLPAAPVAVLDLDLPADRLLEVPAGRQAVVLAQPPAAEGPTRRWQVAFGGTGPVRPGVDLELLVRPLNAAGQPVVVLARPTGEFQLSLAGVEARFQWDLEILHGRLTELQLEAAEELDVSEVVVRQGAVAQAAAWRWLPVGRPRVLAVTLPEPLERRGLLEVRTRSGPPASAPRRAFPIPRLREALAGRATVRVRSSPDVGLMDWQFGHFRPFAPPAEEKDGAAVWEALTLVQAGGPAAEGLIFPSARWQVPAQNVTVQQESWWLVSPERSALTTRLTWQVQSGRAVRFQVQPPNGWEVEDLELTPADLLLDWYPDKKTPGWPLTVELRSPVGPGRPVKLLLRLRPSPRRFDLEQPTQLPIPLVAPLGVRWLEASLAVLLDRGPAAGQAVWRAEVRDFPARELSPGVPGLAGLLDAPAVRFGWVPFAGGLRPDFLFGYHDRPPTGTLYVEPYPPKAALRATAAVTLAGEKRQLTYHVQVRPEAGGPRRAVLYWSAPTPNLAWEVVGGGDLLEGFGRYGERGDGWEFRFRRPLREPVRLRATVPLARADRLPIPVPVRSLGAGRLEEGRALVRLGPGEAVTAETADLTPAEPPAGCEGTPDLAVWRFWQVTGPEPALNLTTAPAEAAAGPGAVVTAAALTLRAEASGRVLGQYRATVRNPAGRPLRLRIPDGAVVRSVAVDGQAEPMAGGRGGAVALPARPGTATYEVVYAQDQRPWAFAPLVTGAAPAWEGGVAVLLDHRRWHLPPGWRPVHAGTLVPGAAPDGAPDAAGSWWEAAAEPSSLLVVRADLPHLAGLFLAALAIVAERRGRRRPGARPWWGSLAVLGGAALALTWLPSPLAPLALWPAAAGLLRLWWPGWRPVRATPSGRLAGAAAALLAGLTVALPGGAAQPAAEEAGANVVYLLTAANPDQATALVPRKLWARLNALAAAPVTPRPYLLTGADYQAQVRGLTAEVEATFQVFLPGDEPADVVLSVGAVRLRRALLDSAPVLAQPQRGPDGVRVTVAGAGRHLIALTWELAARGRGADLELRWAAPAVTAGRLTLALDAPAEALQATGVRGAQWVVGAPGAAPRLEADLGRVGEWAVRWRPPPAAPAAILVQEEAFLLDFKPGDLRLRGFCRLTANPGAAAFRWKLPPELAILGVEAKPEGTQEPAPRLLGWQRTADGHLELTFTYPVSGGVRVYLELAPRPAEAPAGPPLARAAPLLGWRGGPLHLLAGAEALTRTGVRTLVPVLPEPVAARRPRALLGIRADQVTVTAQGAGPGPSAEIPRKGWPADLGSAADLAVVYPARGTGAPTALEVRPAPPKFTAAQRLTLGVSPAEADVQALLDLKVEGPALALLEWQVPADLTVADVTGKDVLRWGRQGPLVQIWFRQAVPAATQVTLTGWLAVPRDGRLAVPPLKVPGAVAQTTHLEVQARGAVAVAAEGLAGLRPVAGPPVAATALAAFVAGQADFGGWLRVTRVSAGPPPPPESAVAAPTAAPVSAGPPVRVFLAAYHTRLDVAGRVVQEGTFTLRHAAGADWVLPWPEDAPLLEVTRDGRPVSGARVAAGRLTVPLPAAADWCQVTIAWQAPAAAAPVALAPLLPAAPTLWTVDLPAGWHGAPAEDADRERERWHQKHAEALLALARSLAEGDGPLPEPAILRALEAYNRQRRLAQVPPGNPPRGPARTPREERLERLRKQAEETVAREPAAPAEPPALSARRVWRTYDAPPEVLTLPVEPLPAYHRQQAWHATQWLAALAGLAVFLWWRGWPAGTAGAAGKRPPSTPSLS